MVIMGGNIRSQEQDPPQVQEYDLIFVTAIYCLLLTAITSLPTKHLFSQTIAITIFL